MLTGRNGREPICGRCAGAEDDRPCIRCSTSVAISGGGLCGRCDLGDRVAEFFEVLPPPVREQLRPLQDRLLQHPTPRTVKSWLRQSGAARLLSELASAGAPLSHEMLDAVCRSAGLEQVVGNLRDLLADVRVLPPLDQHLAVVDRRIARLIAEHPGLADHLHAYGYQSVLPRLRGRERPATEYVVGWAMARMNAAAQLLTSTRRQGIALSQLTQEQLDQWVGEGPSTRHNARDFLVWAADHGRARQLVVPHREKPSPVGMGARAHWGALQRCLRDEELPLDVRVAGVLVLFYGQHVSRISSLSRDRLRSRGAEGYIVLGEVPVLMPQPLTLLVTRLTATDTTSEEDQQRVPSRWLFPSSSNHTRHQSATALSARLNTYGIQVKAGRASALLNAAADASVDELSARLGIHSTTAKRWKRRAAHA
ncbi:hypothetical protein [Streptacidiphilus sp. EB103A]|uniref:hypothetical protein n=1 Tax=Streptacidiphilus sp. EB103A TaxID=3156275 RepID=UPI003518372C